MEEITNKVSNSALVVFDLEDYYPTEKRFQIDISQWLVEGFLLIEKDFRAQLKEFNFEQFQNCLVALNCSTDAIIPAWAQTLVAVHLAPFAKKIVLGNLSNLDTAIYQDVLTNLDYTIYFDKPVILKGCSKKPVPETAYILAIQLLLPYAKSIMFGEACSAVPLYKKKNKVSFLEK